eukprot:TRINITY_DN5861_c0_g1_i1.p1 TRINITY_DN5861_c0_g1~~TRINITY_DN5861_c0_g1_i1.p1  ORF type:complete len:465 (-),score=124.13 TRINITY_DN5861_c0_g1_i1:120-1514(-)
MLGLQEYHNQARLMVGAVHKRPPLQDISNISTSSLKKRKVSDKNHDHHRRRDGDGDGDGDIDVEIAVAAAVGQHWETIVSSLHPPPSPPPSSVFSSSSFTFSPPPVLSSFLSKSKYVPVTITIPTPTSPVPTVRATVDEITDLLFKTCYMSCSVNDALKLRLVCKSWDSSIRIPCHRRNMSFIDDILRPHELRFRASIDYMSSVQTSISEKMRTILVDWMVEVADEFMWHPETFFLAVNYLDRYLQVVDTPKNKLQLIGTACAMLAAKYEEMRIPSFDNMVEIAAQAFTRDDLIKAEMHILRTLNFSMTAVTPRSFLMKYLTAVPVMLSQRVRINLFANYILELAAVEYGFARISASLLAASSLCFSLHTLGFSAWTNTLAIYTQHSLEDVDMAQCVRVIHDLVDRTNHHLNLDGSSAQTRAVFDKYYNPGNHLQQIASVPLRSILPSQSSFFSQAVAFRHALE